MEFEQCRKLMLESAAKHDVEIAMIRESIGRLTNTVGRLVDNKVFLQEQIASMAKAMEVNHNHTHADIRQTQAEIRELRLIVFRHVTDPAGHSQPS